MLSSGSQTSSEEEDDVSVSSTWGRDAAVDAIKDKASSEQSLVPSGSEREAKAVCVVVVAADSLITPSRTNLLFFKGKDPP